MKIFEKQQTKKYHMSLLWKQIFGARKLAGKFLVESAKFLAGK